MSGKATFPCPGCGAALEVGTYDLNVDGERNRAWEHYNLEYGMEGGPNMPFGVTQAHVPFSLECSMRALVAAVRSLDEGHRNASHLRAAQNERNQATIDGFLRMFKPAIDGVLSSMSPPAPPGSPLIGLSCVHGIRLDEPCGTCDAGVYISDVDRSVRFVDPPTPQFCPAPCGARLDARPEAHARTCGRSKDAQR